MTHSTDQNLIELVAARADAPVAPEVATLATALCERFGDAAVGVIAYGSCLRDTSFDDSLVDLYVLVTTYTAAYGYGLRATANHLVPPNVFYLEHAFRDKTLRAKYAVLTLEQLVWKVSPSTSNPYFWARFSQPCAVVFARDENTRSRIHAALASATRTAYANGRGLASSDARWRDVWVGLFQATYRTELRPESEARAAGIVDHNAEYFESASEMLDRPATASGQHERIRANWWLRRLVGKALSVARLIKAGMTFSGGADYLAWKISRHSGVAVEVTPWQRRHPILAALMMAPKLYRRGGFR